MKYTEKWVVNKTSHGRRCIEDRQYKATLRAIDTDLKAAHAIQAYWQAVATEYADGAGLLHRNVAN